jgi:hypothetical protein
VVVRNLDIKSVFVFPTKTNSIPVVNANAILASSISLESFQPVGRRRAQVTKFLGAVDLNQFSKRDRGNLLELPNTPLLENGFRVFVTEGPDHTNIILRIAFNVERVVKPPE